MNKKTTALLVLLLALLLVLIFSAYYLNSRETPTEGAGTSNYAPSAVTSLTYQGVEYPLKKNLQTILLIGTDNESPYVEKPPRERDFFNYHQADYLVLLVVDRDAGKTEVIQINRDTIMNIPWLDVFGVFGGTERKQLCLSFNYGDGGPLSCQNTAHAVSMLLFDLPIDYYIQMPLVGVALLNDQVGGVPVTITEDMTSVDPAFVEGATITLHGTQAEKFVRARTQLTDDTNTSRMRRQRAYMDSFIEIAREAIKNDSNFPTKLVERLGDWIQSNMTVTQMSQLIRDLDQFEISPFRHADGELVVGKRFYEFYVNEDSLWEIVRNACCE